MSDEPAGQPLAARLRAVIVAKDEQIASLTASLEAALERIRRMELRIAELERRLNMDSSDSGTPSSKEPIAAREARKARQRQESERERSKDRRRGGQPGHKGRGPQRDPDPGKTEAAAPPTECRSCRAPLDGAAPAAEPRWAQSADVRIVREVAEFLLPGWCARAAARSRSPRPRRACTPARCPTALC